MKIAVQREDFDAGAELRALSRDPKVGAVASFVGVVREVPMTLEHYAGMTEREIGKIVEDVSDAAHQLQATAGTMSASAQQTSQQATAVAAGAMTSTSRAPATIRLNTSRARLSPPSR